MPVPVDPAVEPIERALQSISNPRDLDGLSAEPESAGHALWLCCCYQERDTPEWLLFETPALRRPHAASGFRPPAGAAY